MKTGADAYAFTHKTHAASLVTVTLTRSRGRYREQRALQPSPRQEFCRPRISPRQVPTSHRAIFRQSLYSCNPPDIDKTIVSFSHDDLSRSWSASMKPMRSPLLRLLAACWPRQPPGRQAGSSGRFLSSRTAGGSEPVNEASPSSTAQNTKVKWQPEDYSSIFSPLEKIQPDSRASIEGRNRKLQPLDQTIPEADDWKRAPEILPPHHLHVYSTKHNTHITLTKPNRDTIITAATGNLKFRKASRGTYDAAYQLAASMMGRIQDAGLLGDINQLEVVFRGFGAGRIAVTKALLGTEGRNLRRKVVRVTDATRLKIGGTRSPKPRRLG